LFPVLAILVQTALTKEDLPTHVSAQIRYILPGYNHQHKSSNSFHHHLIIFSGSRAIKSIIHNSSFSACVICLKFSSISFSTSLSFSTTFSTFFNSVSVGIRNSSSIHLYASFDDNESISPTTAILLP
jgi:hypothetical protein